MKACHALSFGSIVEANNDGDIAILDSSFSTQHSDLAKEVSE